MARIGPQCDLCLTLADPSSSGPGQASFLAPPKSFARDNLQDILDLALTERLSRNVPQLLSQGKNERLCMIARLPVKHTGRALFRDNPDGPRHLPADRRITLTSMNAQPQWCFLVEFDHDNMPLRVASQNNAAIFSCVVRHRQ